MLCQIAGEGTSGISDRERLRRKSGSRVVLAFIRKVDSVAGIILGTQPEAVRSFARFADQLQLAGVVLVYIPDRGYEKNRSGSILASFRDLFNHQFHVGSRELKSNRVIPFAP